MGFNYGNKAANGGNRVNPWRVNFISLRRSAKEGQYGELAKVDATMHHTPSGLIIDIADCTLRQKEDGRYSITPPMSFFKELDYDGQQVYTEKWADSYIKFPTINFPTPDGDRDWKVWNAITDAAADLYNTMIQEGGFPLIGIYPEPPRPESVPEMEGAYDLTNNADLKNPFTN